jgi:hypothetical protein
MKTHQSGLAWHHHLKNLALFMGGVFLMSDFMVGQLGHLSKSVGEAILIAVLVIYLVELQSHQRLEETAVQMIKKVGRNIFGLVYGHELPTPFSESLERMLQQPIYRDQMDLDVHLRSVKLNGTDGAQHQLCRLQCTFSYDLVNCSDQPVTQSIQVFLERDKWLAELVSNDQTDPVLEYLKIGNDLYVHPDRSLEIQARLSAYGTETHPLDALINEGDNGNELVFRKEGVTIPANGRVSVKCCSSATATMKSGVPFIQQNPSS